MNKKDGTLCDCINIHIQKKNIHQQPDEYSSFVYKY